MRTQEHRDETTLQIGTALAVVALVVVLGGLAALAADLTFDLSGAGTERTFVVTTVLAAAAVAVRWWRRRTSPSGG